MKKSKGWTCGSVAERLPIMHKALGSLPALQK
jgi:hypothetical protein